MKATVLIPITNTRSIQREVHAKYEVEMPWSNQSGGGGPWGGGGNKNDGNKSQWGRPNGSGKDGNKGNNNGSNGGGKGGPTPPDMDELLRKGQQKLQQFGGGFIVLVIIILAAIFWVYNSIFFVQPNEKAIKLRFGVPQQEILTNGMHFRIWPIETYHKVSTAEFVALIGGTDADGLMLTSDKNIVNVTFSLYYEISDPAAYLFNVRDPNETISRVAESAMREVVGRRPMNDILNKEMREVNNDVTQIISDTVASYGLGIKIKNISLDKPSPPKQIIPAYRSKQTAGQDRERLISEAKQYLKKKMGAASGEASRIREAAIAYKVRITEEARGRAERFLSIADIEKQAPEATRYRLYVDTMEKILSSPNKLILDKSNSGAVPYLPLNNMLQSPRADSARAASISSSTERPTVSSSSTTVVEEAK